MENTKLFFDSPGFASTFSVSDPSFLETPWYTCCSSTWISHFAPASLPHLSFRGRLRISPKRMRWWTAGSQTCPVLQNDMEESLQWQEVVQEMNSVFSPAHPDFLPSPVSDVPQTPLAPQGASSAKPLLNCFISWSWLPALPHCSSSLLLKSWTSVLWQNLLNSRGPFLYNYFYQQF